jgi:hypothetical protein
LPRVEDLPVAWEGYDRERVQAAFDAFYRHIAQLDATLRALESVEVFREQAGDLRTELRSLRAAGWAPYPRGYTLTPERSMLGSVPSAVPRIALEVVFLIIVAAVVAVANFSALEIVAVMAGAVLITFFVELIASRERRAPTPIPAAEPVAQPAVAPAPSSRVEVVEAAPAAVQESTAEDELADLEEAPPPLEHEAAADDGSGWAAFAEPAGPEPLTVMGALAAEEAAEEGEVEEPVAVLEPVPEAEPEPEPEEPEPVAEAEPELEPAPAPEPEPVAEVEPEPEPEPGPDVAEAETGTMPRRRRFRRPKPDLPQEPEPVPAPKHVRVLPPPESAIAEADLPPWERGFDETDERRR